MRQLPLVSGRHATFPFTIATWHRMHSCALRDTPLTQTMPQYRAIALAP